MKCRKLLKFLQKGQREEEEELQGGWVEDGSSHTARTTSDSSPGNLLSQLFPAHRTHMGSESAPQKPPQAGLMWLQNNNNTPH